MTYVLGIQRDGLSAIIADQRMTVSNDSGDLFGENTCLKAGLLFSGCIFGMAGHARNAIDFLDRARATAMAVTGSESDQWEAFVRFTEKFPPPSGMRSSFSIILASRASGRSKLYCYESHGPNRGLHPAGDYVAIGSGGTQLHEFIDQVLKSADRLDPAVVPARLVPVMLTSALTGRAIGFLRKDLEDNGVGGAFYYVYQTAESEDFQPPVVLAIAFSDDGGKTIAVCRVKIAFVRRALAVHWPLHMLVFGKDPEPARQIFGVAAHFSSLEERGPLRFALSSRDFPELDRVDHRAVLSELKRELERDFTALDHYEFCGLGFAGLHEYQEFFGQVRSSRDEPYDVHPETGQLSDQLKLAVLQRYRTRERLAGEDLKTTYFMPQALGDLLTRELTYDVEVALRAAMNPYQTVNPTGQSTRRLTWFEENNTGIVTFGTKATMPHTDNVISVGFALPITFDLPSARLALNSPIADVIRAVEESFLVPIQTLDGHSHPIYSGPLASVKKESLDASVGNVYLFGVNSVDDHGEPQFTNLVRLDFDLYLTWYRDNVLPKLRESR